MFERTMSKRAAGWLPLMGAVPVFWATLGLIAVALFHEELYFPIAFSVLIFGAVSLFLIQRYRAERVGVLILVLWLVYALPFIHIVPYLWFQFDYEDPLRLWGLVVNPYMLNERIIALTAMLGAVGAIAIALGTSVSINRLKQDRGLHRDRSRRKIRTMALPVWFVWLISGVVLSWLAAPQESVFAARYTMSTSGLEGANFSSAGMMSYVLLSFVFCDAILETGVGVRRVKRGLILAAIAGIVIFFQFLRGDRESVPWLFALALIYFHWGAGFTHREGYEVPWFKMALVAVALVSVSMFVGLLRHSLVGIENLGAVLAIANELSATGRIGLANLLHGTWSAVLLTPLSVAGDHIEGSLVLTYGKDYADLLLSLPPGFVADAVGYVRPISAEQGPAWDMRYGLGGTHATVLPFRNFGMIGVLIVPALWSYAIARFEKFATRKISAVNLSLLATIVLASPHWLWYGEKSGINALIMWLILALLYRISLGLLRLPSAARHAHVDTLGRTADGAQQLGTVS